MTFFAHNLIAALLSLFAAALHPAFADCFEIHGQNIGVSPDLLRAIAITESSGNPAAVAGPKGSQDLGLMQINSQWLSKWNLSKQELLNNACLNIEVGARILKDNLSRYDNPWEAVGAYNAGCSRLKGQACLEARQKYAWKVFKNLQSLDDKTRKKLQAIAS